METQLETKTENNLEYPSNWNVIFWNDDVTPMGFVVYVLKEVFNFEESDAFQQMLKIHKEGSAVVGSYLKAIAESKMLLVSNASERAGFPLKVTIEKESSK